MTSTKTMTVSKYLTRRLEQVGLRHVFGVPGDYVLQLFEDLGKSSIEIIGTCNELNAGYAADAYARVNGIGCACVTYGVGGFSLLNGIVGSFAERLPVVAISGSPKASERSHHHLLHHTIGDMNLQYRIYEEITVASCALTSSEQAPRQIDETLKACLRSKRPVYIELPVDIASRPCEAPGPLEIDTRITSDRSALREAIAESSDLLSRAARPVILAGIEAHRLKARRQLQDLVDHTGYPFATSLLGKTVIPEKHPQFIGTYGGAISTGPARNIIESADIVLSIGTLMTDLNLGIWSAQLDQSKMITANSDNVRIKHHTYNHVSLKDFLSGLKRKLSRGRRRLPKFRHPSEVAKKRFTPATDRKITHKRFFQRMNHFIDKNSIVIADTGDSILSAFDLYIPEDVLFLDQAFYLSIGYSVPATLGAKLAAPKRRPITFVGDGAFQMTAQALGTIIRNGLNPIIFLMNNKGYTIERYLHDGPFNDLQEWSYHKLPEVFGGGWGCRVTTEGELEAALNRTRRSPNETALIEVMLDKMDCSEHLKRLGRIVHKK
ncbi:alpha-keto acid decarboxylase family protein [Candidatus Omnitrophota bacterium]